LGEVYRLRENPTKAAEAYQSLAEWAATDPYHDGWGGSSLATVALWRWLRLMDDEHPSHDQAARAMHVAEELKRTRLMRGMFQATVLSTMPQLEEDTTRRLASVAWSTGQRDKALQFFLEYLSLAKSAELTPDENELMHQVLISRMASPEHLKLWRGERLLALGSYQDAKQLLTEVRNGEDPDARIEAGLYLARVLRNLSAPRGQVADLLSSVIQEAADPSVAETALWEHYVVMNREGRGGNPSLAAEDLQQLVQSYPRGHLAGQAWYELGRHFQYAGDVDRALQCFEQARAFKGPSDQGDMATFQGAMTLYTRGLPDDLRKASELLQDLNSERPPGDLHRVALFWLGRVAAQSGGIDKARGYWEQLIAESPYDYYGIRSRMHLNLGDDARRDLWPDPKTGNELHDAYRRSQVDKQLTGNSPYHVRLRTSLDTRLYAEALAAEVQLREDFPSRRLEDVSLKELDDAGLLASFSLLLASREDALAAKDAVPAPQNRLQIAAAVGYDAGDWPLAARLVTSTDEPNEGRVAAQRDPRYLATAYPGVYAESFRKASSAHGVRPDLLYSVARNESLFDPAALSSTGALGLFQFEPATLKQLKKEWDQVKSTWDGPGEASLLDPGLNIELGALYFEKGPLKRQKGSIPLALMAHNAGDGAVNEWVGGWNRLGRADDLEYEIETIRYLQTRIFLRSVITDMVISNAGELFGAER
jgi:soluble lytic murein transglycosylase-like protein